MGQKKDVKDLQGVIDNVEYQTYKTFGGKVDPTLFRLTLQCLARAPFASCSRIEEFIEMIRLLIKEGHDYTLLLKAGILTGQFPDYRAYKREKARKFKKTKEGEPVDRKLEEFKAKIGNPDACIDDHTLRIPVDIRWLLNLKNLFHCSLQNENARQNYRKYWCHLTMEQKDIAEQFSPNHFSEAVSEAGYAHEKFPLAINKLGEIIRDAIQKKLQLNNSEWRFDFYADELNRLTIMINKATFSHFKMIQCKPGNPYDSDFELQSPWNTPCLIINDHFETEALKFVSIFQNHFFGRHGGLSSVKEQLNDYFIETHRGRSPQENELNALIRRFYRFIKKAYPQWAEDEISNSDKKTQGSRTLAVLMPGRRDVFYLSHGRKKDDGTLSWENTGTLQYDVKNHTYYILRGSCLAKNIDDIVDTGISEFISDKVKDGTLRKISDEGGGGYRVLKKVEVNSPSKAAWLVCGYKRNGLDCWRNNRKETLREFLRSKSKKILANSKSGSSLPESQGEHLSADGSTKPEPR